jgi:hypothetical protein
MHGISLKGLRLKADMLAAIQMHFGVFAKVHAGAHPARLKLQEESVAAPMEHEAADERLKVQFLFAAVLLSPLSALANDLFALRQSLDHIIAQHSPPSPALVALRRILSSTKLSDMRAFPETSSLPNW